MISERAASKACVERANSFCVLTATFAPIQPDGATRCIGAGGVNFDYLLEAATGSQSSVLIPTCYCPSYPGK